MEQHGHSFLMFIIFSSLYSTVSEARRISSCSGWPTEWQSSPPPPTSSQSRSRIPNARTNDHCLTLRPPVQIHHALQGNTNTRRNHQDVESASLHTSHPQWPPSWLRTRSGGDPRPILSHSGDGMPLTIFVRGHYKCCTFFGFKQKKKKSLQAEVCQQRCTNCDAACVCWIVRNMEGVPTWSRDRATHNALGNSTFGKSLLPV